MTPLRGTRTALYVRVSLAEQAQHGFSIDGQLDALRKFCDANRLDIYREYIDAGVSGKSVSGRPQMECLLSDVKEQKVDVVVVWRLSRLTRSFKDLLAMIELFKEHGVALRSLNEQFDSGTEMGRFVLKMLGAAAQLEREQIAENVRIANLEKTKQGKWNAGNNVLGYRWVRSPETDDGRVEIVPEEAELVRHIFQLYASGEYGLKAIVNQLNQRGLITKAGNTFSIQTVRKMLLNRNYISMVRCNVTEHRRSKGAIPIEWVKGEHEPIISHAMWEQVQIIYAGRSRPPTKTVSRNFPLTGLLKCPQCGESMVATHSKSLRKDGSARINYYYQCGRFNSKGSGACRANSVRADDAENWFFGQLQKLLCAPAAVEKIAAAANGKAGEARQPLLERLRELDAELDELEARQKQAFQAFESGDLPGEGFKDELRTIKLRRQEVQTARDDLEGEMKSRSYDAFSVERIRAALQQLRKVLKTESAVKQKKLLRLLVNKITVPSDRSLSGAVIHGNAALQHIQFSDHMEVT